MSEEPLPRLLSLRMAAAALGVSERSLRRLVARGDLTPFCPGVRRLLFREDDLRGYIERGRRDEGVPDSDHPVRPLS